MFTNELKKGDFIRLKNGWDARIEDNLKGNTRLCTVWGFETEMGSVYSHDIAWAWKDSKGMTIEQARGCKTEKIEYTPAQLKCRNMNSALFG